MNWSEAHRTFRTAAIWIAAAAAAFLAWELRAVLLVAFTAVLLAIMLRVFARIITNVTRLGDGLALTLAVLLIGGIVGLAFFVLGSQLTAQFHDVVARIGTGRAAISSFLDRNGLDGLDANADQQAATWVQKIVGGVLSMSLSIAETGAVIAISAIYLAARPDVYRRGAAALFSARHRTLVAEGLTYVGTALKLWLIGQAILMILVGVLTYIAALVIGLPGPIALAFIGGVTEAIPYLGPFIGAVPAVLVALTMGVGTAAWTVVAYLGVHLIEGYVVGPLLQRYLLTIPPALVLIGFLATEVLFGPYGILVAAPLTAALYIAVKVFYIRDVLNERTEIPEKAPI